MGRSSGMAVRCGRVPRVAAAAPTLALTAALCVSASPPQVPAPYGLFVHTDCELKSEYSARTKTTAVQLALTPPGADNSASAVSLILQAQYAGTQPTAPPDQVTILALPAITSNPNIIRGVELEFTIESARTAPLRLFYLGKAWGEYEFVPPGGEITRATFNLSVAEVKAMLLAERVTGRVMNYSFALTGKHLAALRLFAAAIGVPDPAGESPKR